MKSAPILQVYCYQGMKKKMALDQSRVYPSGTSLGEGPAQLYVKVKTYRE